VTTEEQNVNCIIARCKCGGIVFAAVDRPEYRKDTAKSVADVLRRGFDIETLPIGTVRGARWCMESKKHMKATAQTEMPNV